MQHHTWLLLLALGAVAWFAASSPATAQDSQTILYDANGRVVAVTTAQASGGVTASYGFDDADNRLSRGAVAHTGPTVAWQLTSEQTLVPTQKLTSQDGRFTLTLQRDGNLVLHFGATVLWNSGTATGRSIYFRVQAGGNAALVDAAGLPVWTSGTNGNWYSVLTLQNDGNLVMKNAAGTTILWQSNTCCH